MILVWKMYFSPNGTTELEPIRMVPAPKTLNSASMQLPSGVYTTFRTYSGNQILPLIDHVHRLNESALLTGNRIEIQHKALRDGLRAAIRDFTEGDTRIRITLDLEQNPGDVYLALEPLQTPSHEDYIQGVKTITYAYQRQNPRAKKTSIIRVAENLHHKLPGVYESLLLDDQGQILEGMSSNFFGVVEGQIRTAGESILSGITRALVLDAAEILGIPVRFKAISKADVPGLEEAFLTSSSRSVLPIRQIDEIIIGKGKPGPVTQALIEAYWQAIERRLEEL